MKKISGVRVLGLIIVTEIVAFLTHFISGHLVGDSGLAIRTVIELIYFGVVFFYNKKFLKIDVNLHWRFELSKFFYVLVPGLIFFGSDLVALFTGKVTVLTVLLALIMVISVVLFEEYLWRGIIATYFRQVFKSNIWYIVVPGLLFGLWHATNILSQSGYDTAIQVFEIAGFGMLQMAILLRTGNVLYPMILHALLDYGSFLHFGAAHSHVTVGVATAIFIYYLIFALIYLLIDYMQKRVSNAQN